MSISRKVAGREGEARVGQPGVRLRLAGGESSRRAVIISSDS